MICFNILFGTKFIRFELGKQLETNDLTRQLEK